MLVQILCIVLGLTTVILFGLVLRQRGKLKDFSLQTESYNDVILFLNQRIDLLESECASLHELANTDPLTGLLNRRTYNDVIERFKASLSGGEHNRQNGLNSVGFITIDVDSFKQVNDSHGHSIGDEVLKEVAATIKSTLRQSDLIFRMGGDEFSALIPNIDSVDMRRLVEKLRIAVKQLTSKFGFKVTISTGGAIAKNEAEVKELSGLADKALYIAKRKGRDFFQLI